MIFGVSLLGLSLQTSEGVNLEELNSRVKLLSGVFVLILGSADSNSDLSWYVSNTIGPEEPVKLSVNSNILKISNTPKTYLSMHGLLGESFAFSDGSWCSLLESNVLESLVHIESVISDSRLEFGTITAHFCLK